MLHSVKGHRCTRYSVRCIAAPAVTSHQPAVNSSGDDAMTALMLADKAALLSGRNTVARRGNRAAAGHGRYDIVRTQHEKCDDTQSITLLTQHTTVPISDQQQIHVFPSDFASSTTDKLRLPMCRYSNSSPQGPAGAASAEGASEMAPEQSLRICARMGDETAYMRSSSSAHTTMSFLPVTYSCGQ